MERNEIERIFETIKKGIDPDREKLFDDDDIQRYIVLKALREEVDEDAKRIILSLVKKISEDFFFAFEHPATRGMALSLFTTNDDLKRQESLLSAAASEGNSEEMENLSKQINSLQIRYSSTIKQITNLAQNLQQSSAALTFAEREREYYDYKMNKSKKLKKKDIKEERILINEKMKENKKLGLSSNHGLQDTLFSDEHLETQPLDSGAIKDPARAEFMRTVQKFRQKKTDAKQDNA